MPATNDYAEVIIAPGTSGSRVRVLFRALRKYVLFSIALPMTRAEKWSIRKRDVEAVKRAAADRGFVAIELGADADQVMRKAPSDAKLTERQSAGRARQGHFRGDERQSHGRAAPRGPRVRTYRRCELSD